MSECIQTQRLVLRPHRAEDAGAVAALIGNHTVARWLPGVPHPYTEADALAFFARDRVQDEALVITLNGELIGGCGIDEELGYWLGEPFCGHGYASEAARALIERYFARTQVPLMSGHRVGNAASRRVLCGLGFADADLVWRHSLLESAEVEIQQMVLSAEQWSAAA
ncbi:GNAT family N-acetyltransferase [uncultured Roseobacter sp.]|uniref:GNAT family N-acetyltransferase n=1 Tax=uncultured Roseobacter sp. TaxID=114847 RepID=UPI00260A14FD|nr:GNAT family N-acetyltransferase [uncultured Roseobacter sp.]